MSQLCLTVDSPFECLPAAERIQVWQLRGREQPQSQEHLHFGDACHALNR